MKDRVIYLLTGPKGSGKSYISSLMDMHFNIKFVRVEDSVRKIKRGRAIDDQTYLSEAFQTIELVIRSYIAEYNEIVFESTGLTDYFDLMLLNLKQDFKLVTIGINSDKKICLNRVENRDRSIHIDISDEHVQYINEQVELKNLKTDYKIDNNNKREEEIIKEISNILQSANSTNSYTHKHE